MRKGKVVRCRPAREVAAQVPEHCLLFVAQHGKRRESKRRHPRGDRLRTYLIPARSLGPLKSETRTLENICGTLG